MLALPPGRAAATAAGASAGKRRRATVQAAQKAGGGGMHRSARECWLCRFQKKIFIILVSLLILWNGIVPFGVENIKEILHFLPSWFLQTRKSNQTSKHVNEFQSQKNEIGNDNNSIAFFKIKMKTLSQKTLPNQILPKQKKAQSLSHCRLVVKLVLVMQVLSLRDSLFAFCFLLWVP